MAAGDKQAAVAQVWAEALIALAVEAGGVDAADAMLAELESLVELLDRRPDLDQVLTSPAVADAAKRELIEKSFRGRASDLLVDTLQVMRAKRRLELVRAILGGYRAAWLDLRRRVEVRVTSAVPLTAELRQALVEAAGRRAGREPVILEQIDPSLLGGIVVAIGDDKFDASVSSRLARLRRDLLERGSNELIAGKGYFTESTAEGEAAT